jgi:hypothetical protein
MSDKEYIIDGKRVILDNPDAFERTLKEVERSVRPNKDGEIIPYVVHIFDALQVVIEKERHPCAKTGQYFFLVKSIDGVEPPKNRY